VTRSGQRIEQRPRPHYATILSCFRISWRKRPHLAADDALAAVKTVLGEVEPNLRNSLNLLDRKSGVASPCNPGKPCNVGIEDLMGEVCREVALDA
jgi:hypothetical protein